MLRKGTFTQLRACMNVCVCVGAFLIYYFATALAFVSSDTYKSTLKEYVYIFNRATFPVSDGASISLYLVLYYGFYINKLIHER